MCIEYTVWKGYDNIVKNLYFKKLLKRFPTGKTSTLKINCTPGFSFDPKQLLSVNYRLWISIITIMIKSYANMEYV